MHRLHEEHRAGLDALLVATGLLQRIRRAHPTAGLYEAADLQWWWRVPRATDDVPQLFWFDDAGRAEAAVVATDWGDAVALVPILLPDAPADRVAGVVARGLEWAAAAGFDTLDVEVDRTDDARREVLLGQGFVAGEKGVVETWLRAAARPAISPLPDPYRLATRLDATAGPHHLIGRSGPGVEARLRQTSLYRPDLDLVVHDDRGRVAAYGLFWYDPESATGLVEPMRTEDEHQRRGLARHVLTTGVDRLAAAGARRIKICYEPDNPASRDLYLGVGFELDRQTVVFSRRTRPAS